MQHKTTGAADLEQPLPSVTSGCLLISLSLSVSLSLSLSTSQVTNYVGFLKIIHNIRISNYSVLDQLTAIFLIIFRPIIMIVSLVSWELSWIRALTIFKDGLSTKPMCSHSKNCFPFRYGGTITNQIRRLGASCDWSRERFTLDEQLSRKCCWWCCLYLVLLHINVLLS